MHTRFAIPTLIRLAVAAPTTQAIHDRSVEDVSLSNAPLNTQLMSLSIEFDSTVKFFGDVGKPNKFSYKLLQHVTDRAGVPPVLRIGANTADRASFCPDCSDTLSTVLNEDPNDPKQSEALFVTFNAGLFHVLTNNIPNATPIIFGLNFRNSISTETQPISSSWLTIRADSLALAEKEASAVAKYFDQSRVMAYELGNEPNFYPPTYRPETWDVVDYGLQQTRWLPPIAKYLPASAKFMLGSFAGPPTFFSDGFNLANLVRLGVTRALPGAKYYSTHGYPYDICSNESAALVNLTNFLDHEKTVQLVDTYDADIAAVKSVGGILHMGETGTVACHGKAGVSNTLGAAVWTIDYALRGAVMGFARYFYHDGQGDYYYSMWEPVGTELHPGHHVYPTYYSMLFVADIVGDLESPTIASMNYLSDSEAAVYIIHDRGHARKAVLLNTEFYDGHGSRPMRTFDLSELLGSDLHFMRLTGGKSAATQGVSWAGQSVDDGTGDLVGEMKIESVHNGNVTLAASEGAVVWLSE